MSDIAYWLQNHTGNPSVILFTNAICNWYNEMPFCFMNKCCGSAQKVFTVLSSLSYKIKFSQKSQFGHVRYRRPPLRSRRPKSTLRTTEKSGPDD